MGTIARMGGRRIVVVGIAVGLAVFAAPVAAQPDDEIEMDPEGSGSGSGKKLPADPPKPDATKPKPDATKPASKPDDVTPDPTNGDPVTPPAVVKDPKLAKKLQWTAQQAALKGDYLTRMKKPDDAKVQYDLALTAFQKSLEVGDDLNVYFELATLEDKLGKLDDAAKHCRVLIKAQSGVRPDVVKKATAKFDELSTKVGMVTLTVDPAGATVTLAGAELGTAPLSDALILMPGTYTFAFAADGFQPKEAELKVEAGSESERTIELEPVKIIVEPVKPRPDVVEETPVAKPPSKLPLYVGGGATIAFVGVATVTGLLAVSQHGTFTAGDSSKGERADAKSNGQRLAKITDVSLIGAVVAGGFTAYWYVFKYKASHKKADEKPRGNRMDISSRSRARAVGAKVVVVPWVQPGADTSGGFSITGGF